jgi:glycosyltransferase involved in cell wall biosynthesis
MFGLLRLLASSGYRVSFFPDNRWLAEPYTSALMDLGIEVIDPEQDIGEFLSSVSADLDLAILSRPMVAWSLLPLFVRHSPRTRIIYDTVDLHFVRERRRSEMEGDAEVARLAESMRQMELALTARADLTLVVTDVERDILLSELPDASIAVLPNIHDDESVGLPFELREGILFVGSFPHHPNVDAARFLVEDVMPLVWEKLPDVKCYLVGSSPSPEILALERDNVRVLGWVEDLQDLYDRVRVFAAPLRFGAGMKGKIGESLTHGLPVVTTTIGAEGMALQNHQEVLIADEPPGLAKAIIDAYFSKEVWTRLSDNGRRSIAERFSPYVVGDALEAMLAKVLSQSG